MEKRILIVEDDPFTREMLVEQLSRIGFRVFATSDGSSALLQLVALRPNAIILSTSLPNMTAWETLQRVRELSNVPIIALVPLGDEQAKIKCLCCGADHFMTKPLSLRELCARIWALLRRARHTTDWACCSQSD